MNPDHARPLVAFGLVAAAAAVITATGLQANHTPTPATATPVRASTSPAPDLVLGGVLRARPDAVLSNPLAPELWGTGSQATPTGGAVQVASPGGPTTPHKARTQTGGTQTSGGGSQPSQTTTEPVSSASGGPGKSRGKAHESARPTTTTTATATATPAGPDHGGSGRPDFAGR